MLSGAVYPCMTNGRKRQSSHVTGCSICTHSPALHVQYAMHALVVVFIFENFPDPPPFFLNVYIGITEVDTRTLYHVVKTSGISHPTYCHLCELSPPAISKLTCHAPPFFFQSMGFPQHHQNFNKTFFRRPSLSFNAAVVQLGCVEVGSRSHLVFTDGDNNAYGECPGTQASSLLVTVLNNLLSDCSVDELNELECTSGMDPQVALIRDVQGRFGEVSQPNLNNIVLQYVLHRCNG